MQDHDSSCVHSKIKLANNINRIPVYCVGLKEIWFRHVWFHCIYKPNYHVIRHDYLSSLKKRAADYLQRCDTWNSVEKFLHTHLINENK